jgi:cobalt-zinc-cadmium efflux system outer membrane protein
MYRVAIQTAFGLLLLLLVGSGCRQLREPWPRIVCGPVDKTVDLEPLLPATLKAPAYLPELGSPTAGHEEAFLAVAAQKPPGKPVPFKTLSERLQLPADLPGADVPDIKLPPPTAPRKEIEAAIERYFPPLPALAEPPQPAPGPTGIPLALADLQKLAAANSPVLRQAAAEIDAARGAATQAGLYPNPMIGYEGEAINEDGRPGMHGGFIEQTIKTGAKRKLAQAAAMVDVRNAELSFRKTEAQVQTQVRHGYFTVLVARENLRAMHSLAKLTDEVYRVMVLQLRVGEVATYEPMQVRVLALQARAIAVQAHNAYVAAWKNLAANMGLPGLPLTELAGRIDTPMPRYQYDDVLAKVLIGHSDVLTAQNAANKAQLQLQLAQAEPIPDLDFRVLVQRDYVSDPHRVTTGVSVGFPVPVWNRNQGAIRQAQAHLQKAIEEGHRVRAELTAKVAQAFERYDNNRSLLAMYRDGILPNQVQAFRAAVARHSRVGEAEKGGISYNDLVTAEQALVSAVTAYLNTVKDQWMAVVEVAGLLQTDDLFLIHEHDLVAPVPCLDHLPPLPCEHPFSPLTDPALRGADGFWPEACPADPPPERLPLPTTPQNGVSPTASGATLGLPQVLPPSR